MFKPNRSQPFRLSLLLSGLLLFGAGLPAKALELGHSRLESATGQPLRISIPVRQISQAESDSLRVSLAPQSDWEQLGVQPPLALSALRLVLQRDKPGLVTGIQIQSDQAFSAPFADLLFDTTTAQGQERRYISVLQSKGLDVKATASLNPVARASQQGSATHSPDQLVRVRAGDSLWALARGRVPSGVTMYQWLQAVHQANPDAFINGNMHRLKQGVELRIPAASDMRALDAQAAQQYFLSQGAPTAAAPASAHTSSGVTQAEQALVPSDAAGKNRLQLSQSSEDNEHNKRTQIQHDLRDTGERISQLEESVHNLNLALQGQGKAATDLLLEGAEILGIPTDGDSPLAVLKAAGTSALEAQHDQASVSALQADVVQAPSSSQSEPTQANHSDKTKAVSKVSWIQENMLAVMGVVLAFIVLIIAWVLRRANSASRELDDAPAPVSEAMVREKLEQINLDLDQPPSDEPSPRV